MTVLSTEPVVAVRGAALATPGAQAQEQVAADTEFTLEAGDSFLGPSPSGGEFRNDGAEDAIVLYAIIGPVTAATPTP